MGIAWLVCAVGFVVAEARDLAPGVVGAPAGGRASRSRRSLLCALGLPEAVAGIVVNTVILGVVAWAWIARPAHIARRVEGPGAERAAGPTGTAGVAGAGGAAGIAGSGPAR